MSASGPKLALNTLDSLQQAKTVLPPTLGCCRDAFPLFDLPPEAVELVLGFVSDLESKRQLRLACKRCRAIVDRGVVKVGRVSESVSGAQLVTLTRAPWSLRVLHLAECGLGPGAAASLASSRWPLLVELCLAGNRLGDDGAVQLAMGDWPALERLSLSRTGVGAVGAAHLAAGRYPRLEGIYLLDNRVGSAGAAVLGALQAPCLLELELSNNGIGAEGVAELAAAAEKNWPALRRLSLSFNDLGDRGVAHLAASSWPELRSLNLYSTGLGPAAAASLAAAAMPALEKLYIQGNSVRAPGAASLAAASWPALQLLYLSDSRLNASAAASLAAGDMAALQELHLCGNSLGYAGLKALAAGRWPLLRKLWLARCELGGQGAYVEEALRDFALPSLLSLNLSDNRLTERVAERLPWENWPRLREGLIEDNQLGARGAAALVSADLPDLEALHIRRCTLGPQQQGASVLFPALWPRLKELHLEPAAFRVRFKDINNLLHLRLHAAMLAWKWPDACITFNGRVVQHGSE